jgi:hypothetical protein
MAERPNCGLWRLPGELRTSTRWDISVDVSNRANRSASSVPWPIVYKTIPFESRDRFAITWRCGCRASA